MDSISPNETTTLDPGFKLVKSTTIPLTQELVDKFRNLLPSPTERLKDDKRLLHLRTKFQMNLTIPFQWATAKLGNVEYRMNGQHSSIVLSELEGKLPVGARVHLDEYTVSSKQGLAMLFRQFDDRKSGRTPADVSGAYQGLYDDLKEVDRGVAKKAAEAITWYFKEYGKISVVGSDDRYTLYDRDDVRQFIVWLDHDVMSIKTPELEKISILAAIYGTFVANQKAAREFWPEVARGGDPYNETAATTQLDSWLKGAAEDQELAYELSPKDYFQAVVHCWNASRQGKSVTSIKTDHKKGLTRIYE